MRIADLHGWVCGHYTDRDSWFLRIPPAKAERIAVVGAGPAGLSCAYFLRRLGYQVDLLEKRKRAGGLPADALPDYRLKDGTLDRELKGIMRTGIKVIFEKELGKDYTVRDLERDYSAVFLSPGLGQGCALTLPGAKKADTIDALSLLRKLKSNGHSGLKKHVLIIGGGSVAADAALAAKNSGAKEIELVCLESEDQMPMLRSEAAELKKQGIKIHNGWGPREFLSAKALKLSACTALYNSQGEFQPGLDDSRSMEIKFDQMVWAIGQQIDSGLRTYLSDELGGGLLSSGLLDVKPENLQLKIDGRYKIFAGGDMVEGPSTVIQAVASAQKAVDDIEEFLGTARHSDTEDIAQEEYAESCFDDIPRSKEAHIPAHERIATIHVEDVAGLSRGEMQTESCRCVSCGCLAVGPSDLAVALVALDARIVTSRRILPAKIFFTATASNSTVLEHDEVIKEVRIPKLPQNTRQHYLKFTLRKPIDFAIVSVAALIREKKGVCTDARIILGAVAPAPMRASAAEEAIKGKNINEHTAAEAAKTVLANVRPLEMNSYKAEITRTLVKRTILGESCDV